MKRIVQTAAVFLLALVFVMATPGLGAAGPRLVSGANGNVVVDVEVTDASLLRGQERAKAIPASQQSSSSQPAQSSSSPPPNRQAPQSNDKPSVFDKFKASMSSFGRRVFGDDEDESATPSQRSANATTPQPQAGAGAARNFGGQGNSMTIPTTPPRSVPPKPVTGVPSRDEVAEDTTTTAEVERPVAATTSATNRSAEATARAVESSVSATPAIDESTLSAYERLRALRSRAQGLVSNDVVPPPPSPTKIAGRIDVNAIERQTLASQAESPSLRQRGVTAFDDATNRPSVYPTTVAHVPPLKNNNLVPSYDPWNTAAEAVRSTRQTPPQDSPSTLNHTPRDPWGNQLPLDTTSSGGPTYESFGTSAQNTSTQNIPWSPVTSSAANTALQQRQPANAPRSTTDIQIQGHDERAVISNTPFLDVTTQGPQSIVVGQESAYRIRISNRSPVAAEQVVCSIELPPWVDIQPPDVSVGTTDIVTAEKGDSRAKVFRWKLDRIEPRAECQLVLYLVSRERKAFSLQLHYDFKRPSAITVVDVREPRLEMSLDGPGKVLWGSEEVYRLRIHNVGNGDAEAISLVLMSSSDTDGNSVEPFVIDLLKAGEEKTLEVKAWARQNDTLEINVIATGPYSLEAKTSRRVIVMRPQLDVAVDAPSLQFVGNIGEATIVVRNTGSASADSVEIVAALPLGAKYVSSTLGGIITPQNDVVWSVESIPVGGEFTAKVMCEMRRPGVCRFDITAREQTGLIVKKTAATDVESIAELSMKLQNPQGPIEIGSEALYTVTLLNRGTCAAEGVELVIAFPEQVDPIRVEGMSGDIDTARGIVVFDKIPNLGPGQSLTLQVSARAKVAGTHKIRAEVICGSTNTHIAHEESNLFYVKQRATAENVVQPKTLDSGATAVPPSSVPIAPSPPSLPNVENQPAPIPAPFGPIAPSPPSLPNVENQPAPIPSLSVPIAPSPPSLPSVETKPAPIAPSPPSLPNVETKPAPIAPSLPPLPNVETKSAPTPSPFGPATTLPPLK